MRGTLQAPSSADEPAPGLRRGRQRADVRGVQHRRTARSRSRRLRATAARGPVSGITRAAVDRAGVTACHAWSCQRRDWPPNRSHSKAPIVERAGARAHPSTADGARKRARSARGRQPRRPDEHRDCWRQGRRTSHRPAAGCTKRADGRARSRRERRARAPSVAAGTTGQASPLHSARRSPARRANHPRRVPGSDGDGKRAASRPAPIHPN